MGYNPTSVVLREISLTDFYSRIIVHPNGTLNVQGIVAKEGSGQDNTALKPAPAAVTANPVPADNASQSPEVPVRIDTVTLQGGKVNFSDHYIKPNYSASLVEVGGRVSGLSSEEGRLADIDLRGKLENSAPLEIVGKINPLANDLFLDLKVDFRDMDLSPLSPYSGRYAGYGIQKGKLTLSLKYHIEKRKLDSENKVFLDQFTFGDAVESPDATKLPVRLAVALLKDRNGEIHLDLPVTGSIDDPKFSIWGVVWKIIGNLLVKAATSPFALLGAIFGGGEQLSYLEFAPGIADIPAAEEGKLGNLAKALHDRPALKLEIEGHVDIEKDREEMRQLIFRRKVAARKLADLVEYGTTGAGAGQRARRDGGVPEVPDAGLQGGEVPEAAQLHRHGQGPSRSRDGEADADEHPGDGRRPPAARPGARIPRERPPCRDRERWSPSGSSSWSRKPSLRREKRSCGTAGSTSGSGRIVRVAFPSSEGVAREAFGRSARDDPGRRSSGRR